jgi:hypothetical protein
MKMITSVRVTKNEVRIRNKKVVYKKKIRKMGLENVRDDNDRKFPLGLNIGGGGDGSGKMDSRRHGD